MDTIVSDRRYFRITRLCLNIVGIWPYQSKHRKYFTRTILYTIIVLCIFAQVSHVVCFFNMESLTNNFFITNTIALTLMKHVLCCAKSSKFKVLLEGIVKDLKTDSTKEELALMMPYMKRSIYMATAYLYGTMSVAAIFIQMPLAPIIADIINPLNTSRPRPLAMELHYIYLTNEHNFWTIFHANISILITATTSVGCDTLYIYAMLHACGLFEVTGYRFKCAIDDYNVEKSTEVSVTYKKVCRCIKAHDRAISYVREIDDFFCGILFIAVGLTVIGFSFTLYLVSDLKPSEEFYMHVTCLLTEIWHMFFLTFMGHCIIHKTDSMYNELYEGLWYNTVPKTQALFILALRAAMNPPQITAGGVIAMNLQTFAQIMKLSFSYFTVLQSV